MVGFFKFLKRDKKGEMGELDLPPEPPSVEELGEGLPEFPDFQENISAPKGMPNEIPNFDFAGQKGISQEEFPGFPELENENPSMPDSAQQPIQGIMPMPEPMPEAKEIPQEAKPSISANVYPKIERRLFGHERKALRERPSGKTVYIRVDRFKATLGNINTVRNDLRKSEETVTKLENMNNAKGRASDRAKAQLEDLQKKLIFIDKTLFKGE